MQLQVQHVLLAALGLIPVAFAQTSSNCNPLKGCYPKDSALGNTYMYDFTKNGASDKFTVLGSRDNIKYDSDGIHFPVIKNMDSPSIGSNFYIFFGKVDVLMKAAPGHGIVSSVVFQSDCLDEIDLEFIGSQTTQYQTNLFSKGNQETTFGGNSTADAPADNFYTYTVDWTTDAVTWSLNGQVARTVTRAQAGNSFPQTPMQIKIGAWTAGDASAPPGRIQWSEGPIDYSKGPFDMVVKSITVQDYSTGAVQYSFKDQTCSSDSVAIDKDAKDVSSTSKSSTASSTASSSSQTTSTSEHNSTSSVTTSTKTSEKMSTTTSHISSSENTSQSTSAAASTSQASDTVATKTTLTTTSSAKTSTTPTTGAPSSTPKPGAGSSFKSLTVMGSILIAALTAGFMI